MITYSFTTDKGDRPINEDSIGHYLTEEIGLFIVADGLGGHKAGDVASHYVVEQYLMQYQESCHNAPERYFTEVFASIQSGLLAMQKQTHTDMKSTAAAALLTSDQLSLCHIGDTRVYVFGKKKLLYRTLDHSVPQMLVSAGELKEKKIRFHPDRNRLLRALGEDTTTIQPDIFTLDLQPVQAILLCSDGFWEYIEEREMLRALHVSDTTEGWLQEMEVLLKKNSRAHSRDNASAIAIRLDT